MYSRSIAENIKKSLFKSKVVVIYGARQVGKTTLSKQILEEQANLGKKTQYCNCELLSVKSKLETTNEQTLKDFLGNPRGDKPDIGAYQFTASPTYR